MKDYYQILGIPENSNQKDIKRAFRKLAFKHHPDTNPDNTRQAEEKFKEINEAYGVLGDEERRQQYDRAKRGMFAGMGYGAGKTGFDYSQQDIFRNAFSNRATFDELSRMFARAGLRFDQDFLNRVFFSGRGVTFQFFSTPGSTGKEVRGFENNTSYQRTYQAYQPNFIERMLSKMISKVGKFVLRKLFGLQYEPSLRQSLDYHTELEISPAEAGTGGEKQVTYKRDGQSKTLMVKVPPGVKQNTKIRLKKMGMTQGSKSGDLYLHIKIKD